MCRFKRRKTHQPPQSCVVLVFVNRHCVVFGRCRRFDIVWPGGRGGSGDPRTIVFGCELA